MVEKTILASVQQRLKEMTQTEVEAATLVAVQAESEAARLRGEVARLRAICERQRLRLAAVRHRRSCKAPCRGAARLTVAHGAPAASASAAVQTDGVSYTLLEQQVSALQAENIVFNRLRFQCKHCNAC